MGFYNKGYFDWQEKIGSFGGKMNAEKFKKHITKEDTVIDFGSGGGFLLMAINCKEKMGVELNQYARKKAKNNGINTVDSLLGIKDNFADVIISHHALEHVSEPFKTLKVLNSKLKKGGMAVFITPYDTSRIKFNERDRNNHLYTWNRANLGNLFRKAGFKVKQVSFIYHAWPPIGYITIRRFFGLNIFNIICFLYSLLTRTYQVKIIAKKGVGFSG